VRIWPTSGGAPLAALDLDGSAAHSATFSPDGGGAPLVTFDGSGPVRSVAFSADSARVLAGSSRGGARVWVAPPIIFADAAAQVSLGCAALRHIGLTRYSDDDARRFPILRNEPREPCVGIR
jgi:hypothetical protein